MRRLLPLLVALALIALALWALMPRPLAVDLAVVEPRDLTVKVEDTGTARIPEVFTVSANITGKLHRIGLHAGDTVVEGDTVVAVIGPAAPVLLDSRARAVAEATAAAAQAATDLARAQLDQAQTALELAMAEESRTVALFQKGAVSQRVNDAAVSARKTAQTAVASATANLAVRERELQSALAVLHPDQSEDNACCIEVLAPASGRVLRVLTESEQVVQPGTPLLEIGDPARLEVTVDLLSRDTIRIREGADAEIVGWGGPAIPAQVARIEPLATTRVSALGIEEQRVQVILSLRGDPSAWQGLGHGFRVTARIAVWQGKGVLSVPVGALLRDGADWAVYALRDGKAWLTRITLGERTEDHAQVLSGLQPGDRVILHPADAIADGVAITPRPAED